MNVNDFNNVEEIANHLRTIDRSNLSWAEAVELSIRKFQLLSTGAGETGAETCACCFKTRVLHYNDSINCHECVIYDKTGETGCEGTPFYQVSDTREGSVERLLACAKEIEFLNGLKELADEKDAKGEEDIKWDVRVGDVVVVSEIEAGDFQGEAIGVVYGLDHPTKTHYPVKLHIYSTKGSKSWKSFGLDGYELRGKQGSKISKIIDNINDH